jgi:hypothetical protein
VPDYGDIYGGMYDPNAPDVSSLQWPWSTPPQDPNAIPGAVPIAQPTPLPIADPTQIGVPQTSPDLPPPMPPPQAPITTLPSLAQPPLEHAPPPAPLPDVVSGVGGMPAAGQIAGVPYAATPTPEQHYQATASRTTPASLFDAHGNLTITDPAEAQRYLNELHARDPQGAAEAGARLEDIKAKHLLAEHQRIANEDWDRQQANFKMRQDSIRVAQQKSDALLADALRISKQKIDPSGGVHGLQRVAMVIGAAVGGAVQAQNGGRNAGMDALNDTINRGIEAQKADMANQREGLMLRKSALSEEYARTGDLYEAAERVRLASLKHADDLLATEQQKFAQGGTTGMRIAALRAAVGAQMQQSVEAHQQKNFENELKYRDAARQQQIADETARDNRAKLGLEYAKLGAERDKGGPVYTPSELQALHPGMPVPPIRMTAKDYGAWLENQNKGQQFQNQQRSVTHAMPGVAVRDPKTGQEAPFIASGTPESVEKLRKQQTAVSQIVGLIDEAKRVRSGWTSNVGNSEEHQKLNAIWGAAKIAAKNAAELGQITESDVELIKGMLGTDDPSKLRDPIPGMNEARRVLVQNLNVELHGHGFPKDQQFDIPEPPAGPRPQDQIQGKTATELASDATPGAAVRALSFTDPQDRVRDAENTPRGPTGLAPEDTARVAAAAKAYSTAAPADRKAILEQLTAWSSSDRPTVASGVLGLVRGENPALYETLVAKLPAAQRANLPDFKSLGLPGANLPPLAPNKPLPPTEIPRER